MSRKSKYQDLYEDYEVPHGFSKKVEELVDTEIDQPFYEDMDAFAEAMRDLTIDKYKTRNTIGAKETIVTPMGGSYTQKSERMKDKIKVCDIFTSNNLFATSLKAGLKAYKKEHPKKICLMIHLILALIKQVRKMVGRRMVDRWEDDNKMFLALNIKKRVLPAIYGGIIGDLMGVPVEFKQRGTFCIQDIVGYGTYNQPPGTWSDDTSLTLCLVENIMENGNLKSLMQKFVQYKEEGYWTPFGMMFDIGRTTSDAITRFKEGVLPENCGGQTEYDNGNGAVMRIAPLVFMLYKEFNFVKKAEIIKEYTELTHAHPRSIVGSIIYVEFLIRLYHNNSFEKSIKEIKELFDENFDKNHIYLKELEHYQRIFNENFFRTTQEEILSDGYVVHTLEAAIWCLGNSTSFKEAVLKAVNLGGDTDTVAAITGTLAGMYYKMDGIPEEWLEKIVRKQDIDELIKNFYKFCADKAIIEEYGSL